MLASGTPEFPSRVSSIGTHNVHSDLAVPGTPEREVTEHMQLLAEFPSGYMITITCSSVNAKSPGFTIYTHKATLNIGSSGERIELVPEKEFADDIDPETMTGLQPEDIRVHEKNWFDCIRSGQQTNANIDLAIRVQTVISLGRNVRPAEDHLPFRREKPQDHRWQRQGNCRRSPTALWPNPESTKQLQTGFAGLACETRFC